MIIWSNWFRASRKAMLSCRYAYAAFILSFFHFFITSCTSEMQEPAEEERGMAVSLMSATTGIEDAPVEELTRSGELPAWMPNGYLPYDQVNGNDVILHSNLHARIGVFFTRDASGSDPDIEEQRYFFWTSSNKWNLSEPELEKSGLYKIYGYVPNDAATTATVAKYNGSPATYSAGAQLTLSGLSCVMSKDLCIIVGAKHATAYNSGTGVYTFGDGELKTGDFGASINMGGENHLFLLFDHLYSALSFQFTVNEDYDKLRTISITKLELKGYTNNQFTELMPLKLQTSINLEANTTGASPIKDDFTFIEDPTNGTDRMDYVPIFDASASDKSPIVLRYGEYTNNVGFVPHNAKYLMMRTTYDVYDKQGNLIRMGCEAENKLNLPSLFSKENMERGKRYKIKCTVIPTYLYVLSEPDLDNPTIDFSQQ